MTSLERNHILSLTTILLTIHPTIFSNHGTCVEAFVHYPYSHHPKYNQQLLPSSTVQNAGFWDGLSELWEEIIEVSTYGPSERKLLKKQREQESELQQKEIKSLEDESPNAMAEEQSNLNSYDLDESDDSGQHLGGNKSKYNKLRHLGLNLNKI